MWKRIWIVASAAIAVLIVAYFGVGYMVYDKLATVTNRPDDSCPPSRAINTPTQFGDIGGAGWPAFDYAPYYMSHYETVSFPSRQSGLNLSGWYVETKPGAPAVIFMDGLGGCKYTQTVLLPAGMLARNGFNVLLVDMRDTGDSDHEDGKTDLGNKEYKDILGAWDWLVAKGYQPERIGVYAGSLGSLAALAAFGQEPRVAALFVQAPIYSLPQIIQEELARNGMPSFLWAGVLGAARVIAGDNLLAYQPVDALRNAGNRPLYAVASRGDTRIGAHHSEQLAQAAQEAGAKLTLWLMDKGEHMMGAAYYPNEFEARITDFFRQALS